MASSLRAPLLALTLLTFAALPAQGQDAPATGTEGGLKFFDTMVANMKNLPATLPPLIRGEDNIPSPSTVSSEEELTAAVKDGKKEVLLTVEADERYKQLEAVRKEWKKSLFFPESAVENIQQTLLTRKGVESDPVKLAEFQQLLPDTATTGSIQKKPELPLPPFPVFRLKSIVVDQHGRWTVFLNDRKLTRRDQKEDGDIVPLSVSARAVTLKWTPPDPRMLDRLLETAEAAGPEVKKTLPDGNRVTTFLPAANVQKSGVVVFTLRTNQTFVPQLAAIYEGQPPAIEPPVQQATLADDQMSLEAVSGGSKSGGIFDLFDTGTSSAPSKQEDDINALPASLISDSLSSIIGQTRGKVDRLQGQ